MIKDQLHTPLRLSGRRADVIVNAFGVEVAEAVSQDYALPIVHAVNAHDLMLAALRKLVDAADARENTMGCVSRLIVCKADLRAAADLGRAAITQAEGRS